MSETPEVIFDEESHTYTLAGVICPRSVTGLLKKYGLTSDYSDVPRNVLDLAAQRGRAIAVGRELIVNGLELDPATVDPRIAGYLSALMTFWKQSGATLIESEIPHVSPLGFGFRADIYCFINGRRTVIDDKATFKIPKSIGPQTAGYKIGWNSLYADQPIEDRAGLWLKKDGSYRFVLLDDPDDETAFLDILDFDLKIERWQKKYGGKP
jgi:hypothetical protein